MVLFHVNFFSEKFVNISKFCALDLAFFVLFMALSNAELTDVHFMYGLANGNAKLAAKLYKAKFSDRRCPHYLLFSEIDRRLRKRGSVRKQKNKEREKTDFPVKSRYSNIDYNS